MKNQMLFALIFGATASCGSQTSQLQKTSKIAEGEEKIVCNLTDVPAGWVVISHEIEIKCQASGSVQYPYNSFKITKPGKSTEICNDSEIPSGYVEVKRLQNVPCRMAPGRPLDYKNALVIERK